MAGTAVDPRSFDQELLLQELHARGDAGRAEAAAAQADGGGFVVKAGVGGEAARVPELEAFATDELITALRDVQEVIYGTDDRSDLYEVVDTSVLRDADSVVALVQAGRITDNGDGTSTLTGPTFGDRNNLCASEPFRTQPAIAFCSGFLVDPSLVATAAHCVDDAGLADVRFVFGFEMSDATTAETRIDTDQIYRGTRIIGRQIGTEGTDWAVVQLDRPVLDHPFVRLRRTGKIADGAAVHVIGHPSGLPKKYAPGANVRDNTRARYFVANLDTYGGNSGSAVFSSATHDVEGVLVRGEVDFVSNGTCNVSNVCPVDGCRGEDCTRTVEFAELVPANQHDFIPFDPGAAQVKLVGGRWKVVVGRVLLLDFGRSRTEADQALRVIKHYGLNAQCFVGRPHPSMEFYLVDGEAPEGALAGEDCIPFDPARLEVKRVQGSWKVVEGGHWLMDFGAAQGEARQALSYVLRYGFTRMCFVGRPGPSMTYFRR